MQRNWNQVWKERRAAVGVTATGGSSLAALMKADGLDTGFGSVEEEAWRNFVRRTGATMGIGSGDTVWEVGCGAGAFLHELAQGGCEVGGIDLSPALISVARQAMPEGEWVVADASVIAAQGQTFDWVAACGVFMYFPDLDYAERVLAGMAARARRGVMILDLPDRSRQAEALAMRRATLGEAAYAERYAGLDHLYFERSWIRAAFERTGAQRIEIADQDISGYANAEFRFNAFAWPAGH